MIRYGLGEPYINPEGIKFKEGQDSTIVLPKVAIGVFSKHLLRDIIEKYNAREVGYIKNANFEKNVYIFDYNGIEIALFIAGIGGPMIAGDIELLHVQGVEKFIIYGNCGVLDPKIKDCSIVIPNLAYREEGTSYHYQPESDTIEVNPKYKDEFIEILDKYDTKYTIGSTWTTDAFYRETIDKIEYFKKLNVKTVEMETATIAAVCKYLNVDYFTFYYAGDNLGGSIWDKRSLSELSNFDQKKEMINLALELANKMLKNI